MAFINAFSGSLVAGSDTSHNHRLTGSFSHQLGKVTFNNSQADYDFQIKSDDDANMLYVDASEDKIGIGTATPAAKLDIAGDVFPAADNSYDLGSAGKRWRNIYTGDLHLRNERGDWTIVEEEDFLCVVNNKTGKKYEMVLKPIDD